MPISSRKKIYTCISNANFAPCRSYNNSALNWSPVFCVVVTTAENGQRALEVLGLGDGQHANNCVSRKLAFKLINRWMKSAALNKQVIRFNLFVNATTFFFWLIWTITLYFSGSFFSDDCNWLIHFAGVGDKLDNYRLLHARDDRVWAIEEGQGEPYFTLCIFKASNQIIGCSRFYRLKIHGECLNMFRYWTGIIQTERDTSCHSIVWERPNPD